MRRSPCWRGWAISVLQGQMEDRVTVEKKSLEPEQPGRWQRVSRSVQQALRILLGAFLVFAGVSHLTVARTEFLAQVPTWLPVNGDLVVILSGIAEIVLGLALIFLFKQRVLVGLATAAFFVLIFPGNISQYVNRIDAFGLNTDQARLVRLFFQPLLVVWALWATGAWRALLTRKPQSS
jgi:uncharacterized membrane protein